MSQCLTACNPDLIQGVHETEFDTVTLLNMSNFFKAISDPTRLRILQAVRQNPICVGDLVICNAIAKSPTQIGFYKQYGKIQVVSET